MEVTIQVDAEAHAALVKHIKENPHLTVEQAIAGLCRMALEEYGNHVRRTSKR
jgi:hypothetical protein